MMQRALDMALSKAVLHPTIMTPISDNIIWSYSRADEATRDFESAPIIDSYTPNPPSSSPSGLERDAPNPRDRRQQADTPARCEPSGEDDYKCDEEMPSEDEEADGRGVNMVYPFLCIEPPHFEGAFYAIEHPHESDMVVPVDVLSGLASTGSAKWVPPHDERADPCVIILEAGRIAIVNADRIPVWISSIRTISVLVLCGVKISMGFDPLYITNLRYVVFYSCHTQVACDFLYWECPNLIGASFVDIPMQNGVPVWVNRTGIRLIEFVGCSLRHYPMMPGARDLEVLFVDNMYMPMSCSEQYTSPLHGPDIKAAKDCLPTGLRVVVLSRCQVALVPQCIGYMPRLDVFTVYANSGVGIPSSISVPSWMRNTVCARGQCSHGLPCEGTHAAFRVNPDLWKASLVDPPLDWRIHSTGTYCHFNPAWKMKTTIRSRLYAKHVFTTDECGRYTRIVFEAPGIPLDGSLSISACVHGPSGVFVFNLNANAFHPSGSRDMV